MVFNEIIEQADGDDFMPVLEIDADNISEFIRAFEENIDKKKVKRKKGVELFIEEDNENSVVG
jgi:hypothetical protein